MRAKVKASLYLPRSGKLFRFGEEVEIDADTVRTYKDHFEPIAETRIAPAPLNKMITAEKEVTKMVKALKKGRK